MTIDRQSPLLQCLVKNQLGLISYDVEKKKLREQEKGNSVLSTDLVLRSTEIQYEGIKECQHYTSMQKILLVGEGDLSFAACLANAFGNAANMVVTTLDSEVQLIRKYGNAKANLQVLKEKGGTILHQVDAHTMSHHADLLRNQPFDMIVFNFPHAGIPLYSETHPYLIKRHQALLRGFFENAYDLLSNIGEIHVTHKTAHPFSTWNIEELAEEAGLELVDDVCFDLWDYPGYRNKKGEGHGIRCDESFPVGECSTFMFRKY